MSEYSGTPGEGVTWYRVSRWTDAPEPREFARETALCLFTKGGRKHLKLNSYEQWLPTLEEAQAVIDATNAERAARAARERIRDAAPAMLEALEKLTRTAADLTVATDSLERFRPERQAIFDAMHEAVKAISQAKGLEASR